MIRAKKAISFFRDGQGKAPRNPIHIEGVEAKIRVVDGREGMSGIDCSPHYLKIQRKFYEILQISLAGLEYPATRENALTL